MELPISEVREGRGSVRLPRSSSRRRSERFSVYTPQTFSAVVSAALDPEDSPADTRKWLTAIIGFVLFVTAATMWMVIDIREGKARVERLSASQPTTEPMGFVVAPPPAPSPVLLPVIPAPARAKVAAPKPALTPAPARAPTTTTRPVARTIVRPAAAAPAMAPVKATRPRASEADPDGLFDSRR